MMPDYKGICVNLDNALFNKDSNCKIWKLI
jgi:hypothetical protein